LGVAQAEEVIDVRCPVGYPRADGTCHPGKLLLKIRQSGGRPQYIHPDNLIELYCEECTYRLRRLRPRLRRVLHRYDFAGELIETLTVDGD
jgi:transposase